MRRHYKNYECLIEFNWKITHFASSGLTTYLNCLGKNLKQSSQIHFTIEYLNIQIARYTYVLPDLVSFIRVFYYESIGTIVQFKAWSFQKLPSTNIEEHLRFILEHWNLAL